MQSDNNLLLLRFLAEHGPVLSRRAWAEGALTWIQANGGRNYFSNLLTATHSVHNQLVNINITGSRHGFSISNEGRQVLDQRIAVWIRGGGWFSGFSLDLQVLTAKREEEEATRRVSDILLRQLDAEDYETSKRP
jgi:hypothetical protein